MKTKAPFCLVVVADSRRVVGAVGMKQLIHKPATLSPTSNTLLYLLNLLFFVMLVFWYVDWCLFFFLLFTLFSFLFFWLKSDSPHSLYPLFRLIPYPIEGKKTRLYSGTPHKPTTPHTIITLTNTHSHTFEQLFLGTLGCPQVSRIGRSKGISRACSFLLSSFLLLTPLLT
uniref:(northern house mosquito) hypothetical protein n=1 Tax=Culex pipiens TaxID=7175 RepID=A0A8D8AU15_CULPI